MYKKWHHGKEQRKCSTYASFYKEKYSYFCGVIDLLQLIICEQILDSDLGNRDEWLDESWEVG